MNCSGIRWESISLRENDLDSHRSKASLLPHRCIADKRFPTGDDILINGIGCCISDDCFRIKDNASHESVFLRPQGRNNPTNRERTAWFFFCGTGRCHAGKRQSKKNLWLG